MDFGEREIGFREADRRYGELKRQYDARTISDEEFDAQLEQLMVQDDEGRWWAKSRNTGKWHYHDGSSWVRGTPPGYERPRALPVESAPDRRSQFVQDERLPSSQTTLPGSVPSQAQNGQEQGRGVLRWAVIAAGLLAAAGIVIWMLVSPLSEGAGPSSDEASGPTSGYALLTHDSGAFSVEVPSEWDERVVVDEEGEKGRVAWSSFLGEGESAGPSITAVNDLYSWRNGTPGHQGIYLVASKKLAQGYSDDELASSGPNDYSSSCEASTLQDFERPPYSGKVLEWKNCGGEADHTATTLAVAAEGRECVVVAQIGGYLQGERESIQHILETVDADCSKID